MQLQLNDVRRKAKVILNTGDGCLCQAASGKKRQKAPAFQSQRANGQSEPFRLLLKAMNVQQGLEFLSEAAVICSYEEVSDPLA